MIPAVMTAPIVQRKGEVAYLSPCVTRTMAVMMRQLRLTQLLIIIDDIP